MQWEAFADDLLLVPVSFFALQALSSPAPMSFLMRGLLRKSRTTGLPLPLPPSLQKGGLRWGSWDALVLLPEGLPLLPLDFGPAGVVEEPLVVRSVHASSLLSPRFIHGLGFQ